MKTFVHHPPRVSSLGPAVVSLLLALMVLLALVLAGCMGTVAPKQVGSAQGSFDAMPDAKGNYQTSGILGFTNHQAIVTPSGRARYNALVAKWGGKFIPPVKADDGLTSVTLDPKGGTNAVPLWLMDKDHVDKLATMSAWQRQPPVVKPP